MVLIQMLVLKVLEKQKSVKLDKGTVIQIHVSEFASYVLHISHTRGGDL